MCHSNNTHAHITSNTKRDKKSQWTEKCGLISNGHMTNFINQRNTRISVGTIIRGVSWDGFYASTWIFTIIFIEFSIIGLSWWRCTLKKSLNKSNQFHCFYKSVFLLLNQISWDNRNAYKICFSLVIDLDQSLTIHNGVVVITKPKGTYLLS